MGNFQAYLAYCYIGWEEQAIKELLNEIMELFPTSNLHIFNVSASLVINEIEKALKDNNWPDQITVSTAPHYLYFVDTDIPDKETKFKVYPPIRDENNRRLLRMALQQGLINTVTSGHFPVSRELKEGCEDFQRAFNGATTLG